MNTFNNTSANTFELCLQSATQTEVITGVTSFVGVDTTGSFGLQANHERFMTTLIMGIAKFRVDDSNWAYLAVPGAVVYFLNNRLILSTYHYMLDDDFQRISQALKQQLGSDESRLHALKESLHHMEEEAFKRLWEMGQKNMA